MYFRTLTKFGKASKIKMRLCVYPGDADLQEASQFKIETQFFPTLKAENPCGISLFHPFFFA